MRMRYVIGAVIYGLALAGVMAATPARSQEAPYTLVIKDHKFDPTEIEVPANKTVRLLVRNQDTTAEEFDSKSLKREKIIAPGGEAVITVGPLKPGTYEFMGEFHPKTARGRLIVK